jgi:sulfoacetaldehyde dehydrogenase
MAQPSLGKTEELMKQCDFILDTGGPGMVKAAYSSGTPALGVGAGNAVITVDDTADLVDTAEKIRISKTLDLAASCSADNSVIVLESVYDELLSNLIAEGGYVASQEETDKIASVLWHDGVLNTAAVVKQPQVLAKMSGFSIPEDRKFIIVPYEGVGPSHPFSGEKLSAVMAFYKVADIHEAVTLTNMIQEYQGMGHSCGIYSNSDDNIITLASGTKTSRVMVNQPQAPSNSGNLWNGMRQTFSLGCGTWGGNSTNENINWKHLVNITWVSKPLAQAKTLPSDEELFGDVIAKLG